MTEAIALAPEQKIGRREANKRDKLARIREAAREIFTAQGYDAAMVRDIASAAGVGLGTLFLYAKNKQDLLLLIFEEHVSHFAELGWAHVDPNDSFENQVVAFFRENLNFSAQIPGLARDMLREITFSTGGIVATRIWNSVEKTEQHLVELVARMKSKGQLSAYVDPKLAAHLIFGLYRIEHRACVDTDEPDVEASLVRLRQQLTMLMSGIGAQRKADVLAPFAFSHVTGRQSPTHDRAV
jgi:AcrR family transcriptional regulator